MSIPVMISSNVRSLLSKIAELRSMVSQRKFEQVGALVLQESWLHESIEDQIVCIDGFMTFRADRPVRYQERGGGVITYVNRKWCKNAVCISTYTSKYLSSITVKCKPRFLNSFQSLLICNTYITPNCPKQEFDNFLDLFYTDVSLYMDCSLLILAGDFNHTDMSFLRSFSMHNLVDCPTRGSATLDFFYTNRPNMFQVQTYAPIGNSDHATVIAFPKVYSKTNHRKWTQGNSKRVRRRDCAPERLETLRCMVESTDFSLFCGGSLSSDCDALTDYLNFCFDACCPLETIYACAFKLSSPTLKQLRRAKERAYKQGNTSEVKRLSCSIKNEVLRLDRIYSSMLLKNTNPRDLWAGLKTLCGKKNRTDVPKERLNELNRTFAVDCMDTLIRRSKPPDGTSVQFSSMEIYNELKQLNSRKAAGPDGISAIILKYCALELAEPLVSLFNRCFDECCIADCWRTVRITPVGKKERGKFRPIAIQSQLLKIFERLILRQLQCALNFSDRAQFAYKPRLSTLDAVVQLQYLVLKEIDDRKSVVRVCFLDYSNAFNTVDRNILLSKLESIGMNQSLSALLSDYFHERKQFTVVPGASSETIPVNAGVPQGAILSPFFFSSYVQDLPTSDECALIKYADDTTVVSCGKDSSPLQSSLDLISQFSSSIKLNLNPSKSKEVLFTMLRGNRLDNLQSESSLLTISSSPVSRSPTIEYFGLTLSQNFSWDPHLLSVLDKVRRLSFYVARLRFLTVPPDVLLRFITSCLLPLITYCSPVIFPAITYKGRIIIRRCIKIISRCSLIPYDYLLDKIVSIHFSACDRLARNIISDPNNPLHPPVTECLSSSSTRTEYRSMKCRTTVFRDSCLPSLIRYLSNKKKTVADLRNTLVL